MGDASDLGSGTWIARQGDDVESIRVRKCRLEVVAGPDAGLSEVFSKSSIVIGRSGADLELSDRKVSALHAEIHLEDGGYRLCDLGSTNGTFVWGMRVVEVFIGPGATLALGDSAVRFVPLSDSIELPLWRDARMCGLVGQSPGMRRLFQQINQYAVSDTTVLITGETGTGKELVAEAIHESSPRASGPFVVLDCGSIPRQLFEDQIFGHDAGAFTGASRATAGVFEAAHGGTLFVDEIGELPLEVQPKLLRAVETRRIRSIGGARTIDCDVRLVAATNRDLAAEMNRGAFRADLYFRIAVARLHLPPLRNRKDDIELLIAHFRDQHPFGRSVPLPEGFLSWARKYSWPGNVRELRNAIEQVIALRRRPEPLGKPGAVRNEDDELPFEIDISVPFKEAKQRFVDEFDRRFVTSLLDANDWNISAAARAAGVDRMSIYKLLQRLGIRDGRTKR